MEKRKLSNNTVMVLGRRNLFSLTVYTEKKFSPDASPSHDVRLAGHLSSALYSRSLLGLD